MIKLLKLKPRPMRCSFCGKSQHEVRKLIAGGRRSFICDSCVGVCHKIMEAAPPVGWELMTDAQLLGSLAPVAGAVEVTREILCTHVEHLRKRGVSWAAIGSALGISRQAAWERFS